MASNFLQVSILLIFDLKGGCPSLPGGNLEGSTGSQLMHKPSLQAAPCIAVQTWPLLVCVCFGGEGLAFRGTEHRLYYGLSIWPSTGILQAALLARLLLLPHSAVPPPYTLPSLHWLSVWSEHLFPLGSNMTPHW